jgi:hypothetical protein
LKKERTAGGSVYPSGVREPSRANQKAFEQAVDEITASVTKLFASLDVRDRRERARRRSSRPSTADASART